MYLAGSAISRTSLLTEWKGRKGKFVRTFGMNTKRNKNKWRVTWDSIKKYIHTALGYPGIEYEKCTDMGCDLDHVEAETFEGVLEKQKPFNRTDIIDYVLNEDQQSVDLIHEVFDDDFWEKLQRNEIQYVSPMIWPMSGGYEILEFDENGMPVIDAYDWHFVHDAFLKNSPAYGEDAAQVKAMCEGENCQVQLLSAKQTTEKKFPLLFNHNGHLHFLTASDCVQKIIQKKKDSGIKIDDQALAIAYSECGESNNKAKTSFKTCTCDANQKKMAEEEKVKELESKLKATEEEKKNLEAKLKAQDDEKDKEARYAKLKSKFTALFKGMSEKERDELKARMKGMEDEEEMKAMEEVHKEMKGKEDGEGNKTEITELKARIEKMENQNKPMMIDGLIALKASTGVNQKTLREYHTGLLAKSYSEIEQLYSNDEIIIKALPAKSKEESHFEFSEDTVPLKGKSSDEIIAEAAQ